MNGYYYNPGQGYYHGHNYAYGGSYPVRSSAHIASTCSTLTYTISKIRNITGLPRYILKFHTQTWGMPISVMTIFTLRRIIHILFIITNLVTSAPAIM